MNHVNYLAEFISVIMFQVALPVAVLAWSWIKVRGKRSIDLSKQRVTMSTQMRKGYV